MVYQKQITYSIFKTLRLYSYILEALRCLVKCHLSSLLYDHQTPQLKRSLNSRCLPYISHLLYLLSRMFPWYSLAATPIHTYSESQAQRYLEPGHLLICWCLCGNLDQRTPSRRTGSRWLGLGDPLPTYE